MTSHILFLQMHDDVYRKQLFHENSYRYYTKYLQSNWL